MTRPVVGSSGWGTALNTDLDGIESGLFPVNTQTVTGTYTVPVTAAAHNVTMSGSTTFTFTAPGAGYTFSMRLAGAFTPTWPASVKWNGGTAPTYTTPSLYVFTTLDAGTTFIGSQVGKAFA